MSTSFNHLNETIKSSASGHFAVKMCPRNKDVAQRIEKGVQDICPRVTDLDNLMFLAFEKSKELQIKMDANKHCKATPVSVSKLSEFVANKS